LFIEDGSGFQWQQLQQFRLRVGLLLGIEHDSGNGFAVEILVCGNRISLGGDVQRQAQRKNRQPSQVTASRDN